MENGKTVTQKKMAGTLRQDRIKKPVANRAMTLMPRPMEPLNEIEQTYFNYVADLLIQKQLLTPEDIPALTMAANFYGVFVKASRVVKDEGYFQTTQSGYTQRTAHFQAMIDAQKNIREFEGLYGLNLSSRTRLNIPPPKTAEQIENDKFFS